MSRWQFGAMAALFLSGFAQTGGRAEEPPVLGARFGDVRMHHRGVIWLVFSPDGKTVASVGSDGRVSLWDVKTGEERRHMQVPTRITNYSPSSTPLAFSPDGRTLALGGPDTAVRLWDVSTGKETHKFGGFTSGPLTVAFRPDGKVIAVGGWNGPIRLWALPGGDDLGTWGDFSSVFQLAYARDGRTLAAVAHVGPGNQKPLFSLWDVTTAREVVRNGAGGTSTLSGRFAPDGPVYCVLTADGKSIRIFDVDSIEELRRTDGEANLPVCLADSSDGCFLTATSRDGVLRVWEMASGKQRHAIRVGTAAIDRVALSPDGSLVALTVAGTQRIQLWDLATARERFPHQGHDRGGLTVAFSRDGATLYTVNRDETHWSARPTAGQPWSLRTWNLATCEERSFVEADFGSAVFWTVFSPDATQLAVVTQDGTMRLLDVATGEELSRWQGPMRTITSRANRGGRAEEVKYQTAHLESVSFSPNGDVLYATTPQPEAKIHRWEVATGKALPVYKCLSANAGFVWCSPSPDAKTLLLSDFQPVGKSRLIFIAADTGREFRSIDMGRQSPGRCCAFSSDGRTLFVARLKAVRAFDVETGQLRGEFASEGGGACLAVSPDGQFLAATHTNGVTVWHAATGRPLLSFSAERWIRESLVFSPDGKRLATGGGDATALVWDTSGLHSAAVRDKLRLEAAELEDLWNGLGDGDSVRAYRAVGTLALYPREAVPFLSTRLKTGPTPEERRMVKLIADLDSDEFDRRDKASTELAKLGRTAEKALRRTQAEATSPELRRRLIELMEKLGGPQGPPPPSADTVRSRIVEALEGAGTAEARRVLGDLARGPAETASSRAANEALNRLAKRVGP